MLIAISSYSVVLALHIMAVVAAFGLPLAYPMLVPYARRHHARSMPALHDVQHRLNQRLTAPATVLILGFGAYLASKGHYWSEPWVDVPLVILVVIGGLGGAFVAPACRRLSALARADVDVTPAGADVAWGAEYDALYRRYLAVESLLGALVLVAIFFMATRPFA